MSEQIKICPACNQSNPVTELWCLKCGNDLSFVSPVFPEPARENTGAETETKDWACSKCGGKNGAALLLCTNCGSPKGAASETTGQPAQSTGGQSKTKLMLVSGNRKVECKDGDILGREGDVARELFENIPEVSNEHVLVSNRGDSWFVKPLRGATNETTLDGKVLERGTSYPLTGSQQLGMSTKCTVRLEIVSQAPTPA